MLEDVFLTEAVVWTRISRNFVDTAYSGKHTTVPRLLALL
jgi:hypothetical protein